MTPWVIVLFVVGTGVGIFVFLIAFMALLFLLFARGSGWTRLVERYGVAPQPVGQLHPYQTIKVGAVRWRWSTTVGVSETGLYIEHSTPFRPLLAIMQSPPVLIPWSEITVIGPGRIYLGWACTELAVGSPKITSITVPNSLYEILTPYLGGGTA